jgi:hypothetical protein
MRSSTSSALAILAASGLALAAAAHEGMNHQGQNEGNHPPKPHVRHTILAFDTMYGVDGPFVGDGNPVRGVPGDESPWVVDRAFGTLDIDGNLVIVVRGLVFKDNPDPTLIGKNDEPTFQGLVSCLTEDGNNVKEANIVTPQFPATNTGDSVIHAKVDLPNPCVAPIVMVLAGSEFKWFSMTGFEQEED